MRLFISYASEDGPDFAEPLAKELGSDYDVWFAPYELKVGDSLLAKINDGLRSCDYGVVILSHHFFAKKWPAAELSGLFALEEPSKKVILPVWRGLSEEDVKRYSPILADRKAADGSSGVEAVAAALRLAIDTSGRQQQLAVMETALERFKGLAESIKERQDSTNLLGSPEGVKLVVDAARRLCDVIEKAFSDLNAASQGLRIRVKRHGEGIVADTFYALSFHLYFRNMFVNTATSAVLTRATLRYKDDLKSEWDIISKDDFKPSFRKLNEVVWKRDGDDHTLTGEQLAADALEKFRAEIEQAALRR